MGQKKLTVWEAACIITGYGIGGGVLAMPYLVNKNGIIASFAILLIAFLASYLLHLMIADVVCKCKEGNQVVSIFSRFLFRGRAKFALSISFFVLMAIVLIANLAAYIEGSSEVITSFLPLTPFLAKLLFYCIAASVVLFGLKAVGVSEKIAVIFIFLLILTLAFATAFVPTNPLPLKIGGIKESLNLFGIAMLAFSSFFSIPQAVEGLEKDAKKIKKAVFLGLFNNFVIIIVISISALLASKEVTIVAIAGWSAALGPWAQIVANVFTILAMLTTYWSISLALSSIVEEQLKLKTQLCWLLSTLPSLLLTLIGIGDFLSLLEIAGGAIAIIVAVMVVPTYRIARKEIPEGIMKRFSSTPYQVFVVIAYIIMAVGNLI